MKTLHFAFDVDKVFGVGDTGEAAKKFIAGLGFGKLLAEYLNQGISSLYPPPPQGSGVPMSKGKVLGKVQTLLEGLPKDSESTTLEDAEFDLLKFVFLSDNVSFAPNQVRIASAFADTIEKARDAVN